MANTISFKASSLYLVLLALVVVSSAQLSPSFYNQSCPNALSIIQTAVFAAVNQEARMGASLLRLHFHDCFVQGCDASVLLDSTSTMSSEKDAAPNMNSLRGFEVIDDIKSQLESACPQTVSCADILTIAARDSVVALGGANWTVLLGRRDSLTANQNAANTDLPSPDSDLSTLISAFANKGLSTTDMIALSGAHTIGISRCSVFQSSISSDTSTKIDPSFAASLQANCTSGVNNSTAPLDTTTPTIFDTKYYQNLMDYKGLLHSDRVLYNNGSADSQVSTYVQNPYQFFTDFITGMINMGNISPLTGPNGEVRVNCRKTN